MSSSERESKEDASKASFKLDLIETVNADPAMEASDLKLIAAYAAMMTWPKREAWLSTSRARAMTGLSERQVINSRARLAGKNVANRAYLYGLRKEGSTTVFRIDNPWREQRQLHVTELTDHLRGLQRDRQTERRRIHRSSVSAMSAGTDGALSQSPGECDVPAMNAGNSPAYTPQYLALKEETPPEVNSYGLVRGDDPHLPFSPPETEDQATEMVMGMLDGQPQAVVLELFDQLRQKLLVGDLSPAEVAEILKRAA